jgi:hypothetical protein
MVPSVRTDPALTPRPTMIATPVTKHTITAIPNEENMENLLFLRSGRPSGFDEPGCQQERQEVSGKLDQA